MNQILIFFYGFFLAIIVTTFIPFELHLMLALLSVFGLLVFGVFYQDMSSFKGILLKTAFNKDWDKS